MLTQEDLRIPEDTKEFANMSNQRHWAAPVKRYIDECLQGRDGPRGKDQHALSAVWWLMYNRILTRGGVFVPVDNREPEKPGKLRLMYEANPDELAG